MAKQIMLQRMRWKWTDVQYEYERNTQYLICFLWVFREEINEAVKSCGRIQGSSVSIVSGYGLEDRAIEVRSPTEARDFSSNLCVQTCSGAHPAPCIIGSGGPFPEGKARTGRDADRSPHLVSKSLRRKSSTSSPSYASLGVLWDCFKTLWLCLREWL
jgi:hypothetical protein